MLRLVGLVLTATLCWAGSPPFAGDDASAWSAARGTAIQDGEKLRDGHKSLRVEAGNSADAAIQSRPVALRIGKVYELSGWVQTERLEVTDHGRSPIATGAVLTMASMPFDVHSAAVSGT